MSSSPKQGTTTTVETQAPWQAGYLRFGYDQAADYLNNNLKGYQGPYVANQSPYTQQAIQLQAQRGLNGSPLTTAYQQQLTDTLNGKYLDPSSNPYLSGAVNDALGLAKSQYAGMYGGNAGGNVNNSGFQEGLARTLGNTALPIYAGAYQNARQNQMQAAALAPNAIAQDYQNIGAVSNAGAQQDAYQQALVNAQQLAFNAPWLNLQNYQNIINGQFGGTGQSQNPYFTNPTANALGLATSGLGLYNAGKTAGLWGGAAADTSLAGDAAMTANNAEVMSLYGAAAL